MKWAAGFSREPFFNHAMDEACEALEGLSPDLLFCFVSSDFSDSYEDFSRELRRRFPRARIFGSSASGTIGAGEEAEGVPAISLLGGETPDVEAEIFWLGEDEDAQWAERLHVQPEHQPLFLLLGDPFHKRMQMCIEELDKAFPAAAKAGGIASGTSSPMQSALFLDGSVHRQGTIGMALFGDISMHSLVAQGCVPVGPPMEVTKARDNLILELDGVPSTLVLQRMAQELPKAVFESFQRMPMVGVQIPYSPHGPDSGGFLVRNLLGISRGQPGLLVGAHIDNGQIIQFHLRSKKAAVQELENVLDTARGQKLGAEACLLFSCIGRGGRLYGAGNFESSLFLSRFPGTPMAGFFCNGEIGPVRGRTFIHGYTSSYGVLAAREWS